MQLALAVAVAQRQYLLVHQYPHLRVGSQPALLSLAQVHRLARARAARQRVPARLYACTLVRADTRQHRVHQPQQGRTVVEHGKADTLARHGRVADFLHPAERAATLYVACDQRIA
ncbi:hypothetical protein D3C72_847710 [compost metagenome]